MLSRHLEQPFNSREISLRFHISQAFMRGSCEGQCRRARTGRAATVVEFAFVDFVPVGGRVSETHCIKTYVKIRVLWKNPGRL